MRESQHQNLTDLTQSQLLLWTGQKLNPRKPLYNMAHAFDISGPLDHESFRLAFDELIRKVAVLRTQFLEVDHLPYQKVLPEIPYHLEIIDAKKIQDSSTVEGWIRDRSMQNFDFTAPLFDSVLISMDAERHIWFLNLHHLITDATSSTILFDIMSELYRLALANELSKAIEIRAYADYVRYENEQRTNDGNKKIQAHWKAKIKLLRQEPKFYGNLKKPTDSHSKRVSLRLEKKTVEGLRQLALSPEIRSWTLDATMFNLFATALFVYLNRVSGQRQLAIGAPSHNRSSKTFKKTPGLFIEVFPLIMELNANDTFTDVLKRIRTVANEYLRYAQAGMADAEVSRSFNVIFNYINASFSEFNGQSVKSTWIHPDHCDPNHQLRCHVYDMDASGEIDLFFDLNTEIFDAELIQNVPLHFKNILDALILDLNQSIYRPVLATETEITANLAKIDANFVAQPDILSQFEEQVGKTPTAIALSHKEERYSFSELNLRSNKLANYIRTKGVSSGHVVSLYLHRSPAYIMSVLAVMKTGATFIPIASDNPTNRVIDIVRDSGTSLIISDQDLSGPIAEIGVSHIDLDRAAEQINAQSDRYENSDIDPGSIAYILYTSGSTGNPKGVMIPHGALINYLNWGKDYYKNQTKFIFPLFTSIGFDLTITATFLPLITGGELIVYREPNSGPDMSILEVIDDNLVNTIKLTPAHLALVSGSIIKGSKITTMIVGGEDFKSQIAKRTQRELGGQLRIFNEYGPTEATVGCIVAQYDDERHTDISVPIGSPIKGMHALLLDDFGNVVPNGVTGHLYLGGIGLALGYLNSPDLTRDKFIPHPHNKTGTLYKTGDLARWNKQGELEYLGRVDEQVKLRGHRIELSDIEANLLKNKSISNAAVVLLEKEKAIPESEVINCTECGLPSNYPKIDFDDHGVCHLCTAFKGYEEKAKRYFKTEDDLRTLLLSERGKSPEYDCLSLLSGGKDSTYILAQLVNMGLKVLAFTLDNGYISDQAKANIDTIVKKLGVDHIYGETPHMNKIFVDSLQRHKNVCNGCFKTIYTLSTQVALEKQIPFVVTGLSRGQFFETRLTEELFWDENVDVKTIDHTILQARKLYHQEDDAVKELLDVSAFQKEETFNKVRFIDFYRYSDVSLEDMLQFLKEKVGWVRPTDTGRSTNCLINQVGIYVHKRQRGYSNYSFPYSWDVRLGHKTRTETLEEINEVIDTQEVKRIMGEIGYEEQDQSLLDQPVLVGYYSGDHKLATKELSDALKQNLPPYMVPTYFKYMEELPLTSNGKVDKTALKGLNTSQLEMEEPFVAPEGEIEELLASIWREVLRLDQVGTHDNFIALGGHSLAAIRVNARITEEIEIQLPLNKIFELPTIALYAKYVENTLVSLLEEE